MVRAVYSKNQVEMAELLVRRVRTWIWARRKRDGLEFVIFPSSQVTVDGQRRAWYSTAFGCNCPSFTYRGGCSHELAVRTARGAICQAPGCTASVEAGEHSCERHQLVDAY